MKKLNFITDFFKKNFSNMNSNTIKNILLVVFLVIAILSIKKCSSNRNIIKDFEKVAELRNQEVKQWKDDADKSHAKIEAIEADKIVIQSSFKKELDSMANILKIKSDKITEYTQIISQAQGSGSGQIQTIIDTIFQTNSKTIVKTKVLRRVLPVNDYYLNFVANIKPDSSFTYTYTYKDSLFMTKYTKKYGLFNLKKRTYIDVFSNNKNAVITGLKQFAVTDNSNSKYFSLVLGPGIGWDGTKIKPTINLTVGLKLFSF